MKNISVSYTCDLCRLPCNPVQTISFLVYSDGRDVSEYLHLTVSADGGKHVCKKCLKKHMKEWLAKNEQ